LSFFLSLFPIVNLLPTYVNLCPTVPLIRVARRGVRPPTFLHASAAPRAVIGGRAPGEAEYRTNT
jgi:hypothetical protein